MGGGDPLRALAVIEAADAARELDELPSLVLPVLAEVLGADTAGWTALRVGATLTSTTGPVLHSYPAPLYELKAFEAHAPGCPIVCHTRPGGPGHPVRRSDLQSLREFRASGMYADVVRPMGTDQILATALVHAQPPAGPSAPGGLQVCVSLQRCGRDFTLTDVALLTRLRPLLARRVHRLDLGGPAPAMAALTDRQQQILSLVALGLTDTAIGRRLGCSPRTVDKHLERIYRQLGVHNRAAATAHWFTRPNQPVPFRLSTRLADEPVVKAT